MRSVFPFVCLGIFLVAGGIAGNPTCDFNSDGECDLVDIDDLIVGIATGSNNLAFDLNGDAAIDLADRDIWLEEAALINGFAGAYLIGDANLDGSVTAIDLMRLGFNWQLNAVGWFDADFNADLHVDSLDLNELGINWQKATPIAGAIPEPNGLSHLIYLLLALAVLTKPLRGALKVRTGDYPQIA